MLRKIRITLASVFFLGVTLLFLDFTGTIHTWLGWMAKIQFLPAVLALNFAAIAIMVILTLLFGRVYCSVICPLGILQDIASWIRGRINKKSRTRFSWSPANNWLRYGMLILFIVSMFLGAHALVALIAPYSAYGRIASNLLAPIYIWGNNLLADWAVRAESYTFYHVDVWVKSLPTLIIAAATFIIIVVLAWTKGRTWCNTICPVGTTLGFLSRFSLFAPVIDTEKCKNCRVCERKCKASCISTKEHKIDYSRCVACMDCIDACKEGAIHYAFRYDKKTAKQETSPSETNGCSRRDFFATTAVMATVAVAAKAQELADGGLTEIDYAVPVRKAPIVPAGAKSMASFREHCTGCQLCVSVCPNNVLRPSNSASLESLMQPEMSYERGYCRPECTKCSEVCPTGAICKITKEEKSSTQIGLAVVDYRICVVNTDDVKCGNCARHCPVGAIRMVRKDPNDSNSVMIPSVNEEKCIGCGACENLCPSRPVSAIRVNGYRVHRTR